MLAEKPPASAGYRGSDLVHWRFSEVSPSSSKVRLRFEIGGQSMAIAAGNRHVASGERKPRLTVPGQAECRGHQSLQGVAIVTAIEVRGTPKLPGMLVAMTIATALELQLEQGNRINYSVTVLRYIYVCLQNFVL